MNRSADVAVIGGGIFGCSVAWRLAQRGFSVVVVERDLPGFGASVANPGSLAVQNKPLRLTAITVEAVAEWMWLKEEFGLDVGYKRTGGLRLAQTPEQAARLAGEAVRQQASGAPVFHLQGEALREAGPYLGPSVVAANWCEMDGYSNSLKATPAFVRAAMQAGVTFMTRTRVNRIRDQGNYAVVETTGGDLAADRVVVSASDGSPELVAPFGYQLPMERRVMQVYVTERLPRIIAHMITHAEGDLTLKQSSEGSILIGGGWKARLDRRGQPTPIAESLNGNARRAVETIPVLGGLQILRCWGGVDHQPEGRMPRLGPLPGSERVWLLTACTGGYTLSILLARWVAEWMESGICPEPIREFAVRPLGQKEGIS